MAWPDDSRSREPENRSNRQAEREYGEERHYHGDSLELL